MYGMDLITVTHFLLITTLTGLTCFQNLLPHDLRSLQLEVSISLQMFLLNWRYNVKVYCLYWKHIREDKTHVTVSIQSDKIWMAN